jgi:Carboxypeptidase regulatory-like domain
MRRISIAILLSVLFFMTGLSYAQTTSGDLVGIVKDKTGAAIANASVVATDQGTKLSYKDTATGAGEFHIPNLPAGNYDLTVSAPGFSTLLEKNFRIDINKSSTANLTLSVSSNTSVEVSTNATIALDTTTSNLTQTFGTEELAVLPSATVGLGVLNVSLLSPGVASSGGVGIGTGPSVGGQRPRNNNFMIEGVDNNDKGVTGPLVYIPNDAVGEFSLITNQFSPEFGHSSGGQFNTNVISGTNKFHGSLYEYFQNRNLNAENLPAGQHLPNPRYDFNRYGGQIGGPILKDKLFFFGNYERQTTGQSSQYQLCTPTAAGISELNSIAGVANLNATNLAQYVKYMPVSPSQVDASVDAACFNQATGPQSLSIYSGVANAGDGSGTGNGPILSPNVGAPSYASGTAYTIPLGNYVVNAPNYSNFGVLTTSGDWTITPKDSFRLRYLYNNLANIDTAASLPAFFQPLPFKYHLVALSEYHTFTQNLTNEARIGYNRYATNTPSGPFSFPGLDSFPNLTFYDQNGLNIGPDGNAPQSTVQNLYQFVDNISWTKGKHQFKIGFDGRKYISPQTFTQRVRGDYQYDYLTEYLHDLAPTDFGQRSTGDFIYYGDQTALYGYANDTWRALPTLTLNFGIRYEFTSVPVGERAQALNSAASVPGLVSFNAPQPQYRNFTPRIGINWAPDDKTSVRAAFGMAQDVLFDNLGLLSFPPQYSSTNSVGTGTSPNFGDPNFLASGGLPAGTGTLNIFPNTPEGLADQRAATSALLPNQIVPYAETWSLGVQRVFASNYTAEIRYVGTRGIHLPTQDQINIQPRVNASNQLFTELNGPTLISTAPNVNTLAQIQALSNIVPAWKTAGFTSALTSYQPFSQSNYNGLQTNLTRRFQNGFLLNGSYTWSKTMDDATAEVFATVLTPRRPQNSQCIACDYGRSALDRTNRLTIAVVYDVPYFKHSNWMMKNLVGNWEVSPIYVYESPEYATTLSGVNSNLNGDSGTAIDRPVVNANGVKGTASGVSPVYSSTLSGLCTAPATTCSANLVGYVAKNPDAYYIQAAAGTLPNAARNTLPIRPIDDIDMAASKRVNITERYSVEFQAQAFNLLNHPQYIPGSLNNINTNSFTSSYQFQTVTNPAFNHPELLFNSNARSMQLSAKFHF